MTRLKWEPIIEEAVTIATAERVTKRQLFYRLLSKSLIPNTRQAYKYLCSKTAELRRRRLFPPTIDLTRSIHRLLSWDSAEDGLEWLSKQFRLDRQRNQPFQILLGVEKDTLLGIAAEVVEGRSIPVIPLRGFASQEFIEKVRALIESDERPTVLLYVGDLDASGMVIGRNAIKRLPPLHHSERIAVLFDHIDEHALIKQPGKPKDRNKAKFIAEFGSYFQVEAEALPPAVLRSLILEAVNRWWDSDLYDEIKAEEVAEFWRLTEALEEEE